MARFNGFAVRRFCPQARLASPLSATSRGKRERERERERERDPLSCLSRQRSGWRATRGSRWSGGVGFAMEGGWAVGGIERDGDGGEGDGDDDDDDERRRRR